MNRNPCCGAKRPDRAPPIPWWRNGRRPLSGSRRIPAPPLPAVLLLLCCLIWPPGADAAESPPIPQCPLDRELCVRAERTGGIDLKTGSAYLEGNVVGLIRSRKIEFRGQSLRAFRDGGKEWVRLVLEREVSLRQPGRETTSDQGVLEKNLIRLNGHVRIHQAGLDIEGDNALIETDPRRTVINGQAERPVRLVLRRNLLSAAGPAAATAPPGEKASTVLTATKVEMDEDERMVTLAGRVDIRQEDGGLEMRAEMVVLHFDAESALSAFQAEGEVVITQPGRRVSADRAISRNQMRTILLIGNAALKQNGQFDLKSDRLEVYSDADKGILQSRHRDKPITLSLDLNGRGGVQLTSGHLATLSRGGVPPLTLEKLGPLLERNYASAEAFENAVRNRLSLDENTRYLPLIVKTVR